MLLRLTLVFAMLQVPSLWAQASVPVPPAKPAAQAAAPAPGDATVFDQPPPAVDAALRARLNEFYQCYVDGTFRKAYEMVAEDSKDIYFDAEKSRYKGFKILRIEYTDNYTKANVMVGANIDFNMQGTMVPTTLPLLHHWKYENGNWFWYVIPRKPGDKVATPFGPMTVQPEKPGAGGVAKPGRSAGASPKGGVTNFFMMPRLVSPAVSLTAANGYKGYLELMNPSKTSIKLEFSTDPMPGLTLTPASQMVAGGKTGVIEVSLAEAQAAAIRERTIHNVTLTTQGSAKFTVHALVVILPKPVKP